MSALMKFFVFRQSRNRQGPAIVSWDQACISIGYMDDHHLPTQQVCPLHDTDVIQGKSKVLGVWKQPWLALAAQTPGFIISLALSAESEIRYPLLRNKIYLRYNTELFPLLCLQDIKYTDCIHCREVSPPPLPPKRWGSNFWDLWSGEHLCCLYSQTHFNLEW